MLYDAYDNDLKFILLEVSTVIRFSLISMFQDTERGFTYDSWNCLEPPFSQHTCITLLHIEFCSL